MPVRSTGERLRVAVAGPPGAATDAVRQTMRRVATVVDVDSDPPVAAVVLVNPAAADWLAARGHGGPIVAIVGHALSPEQVALSVLWGAEAVLHTRQARDHLTAVLRAVLRGATVLSATETRALAVAARAMARKAQPSLSNREREIAALIAQGFTIKQTAAALGIAPKTVENLQGRLFRKLGVRNRAQAAASMSTVWPSAWIPHDDVGGIPT